MDDATDRRRPHHLRFITARAIVLAVLWPASAHAIADHLTCYGIRDPQPRATYTGTLLSFPGNEQGGGVIHPGCLIRMPAKLLCQATSKSLVDPAPPGAADGLQQPNSFLCYKAKCPGQPGDVPLPVQDQFGARTVTRRVPKLLCAPAAGPTATTTTTTTSTTTSTSAPAVPCGGAAAPACDGMCSPGELCVPTYGEDGWVCFCQAGLRPCGEAAGPSLCFGECPPDTACIDDGGVCRCASTVDPPTCGGATTPQCNGRCPAGETCAVVGTFECGCIASTGSCADATNAPDCIGECAPGAACFSAPIGGGCECRDVAPPPACGDAESFPGYCDGTCPPGQQCVLDGACYCVSFACGDVAGPPLCLGECPAAAPICRDVGGTCECRSS